PYIASPIMVHTGLIRILLQLSFLDIGYTGIYSSEGGITLSSEFTLSISLCEIFILSVSVIIRINKKILPKRFGREDSQVRKKGLEPPRLAAPDPKSGAATNYATSAVRILFCATKIET